MNMNICDPYKSHDNWLNLRARPRKLLEEPKIERISVPFAELTRYIDLSKPRDPRSKFEGYPNTVTEVSAKARNYHASQRIVDLAVPRKHTGVGDHFIPYSNYLHLISRP